MSNWNWLVLLSSVLKILSDYLYHQQKWQLMMFSPGTDSFFSMLFQLIHCQSARSWQLQHFWWEVGGGWFWPELRAWVVPVHRHQLQMLRYRPPPFELYEVEVAAMGMGLQPARLRVRNLLAYCISTLNSECSLINIHVQVWREEDAGDVEGKEGSVLRGLTEPKHVGVSGLHPQKLARRQAAFMRSKGGSSSETEQTNSFAFIFTDYNSFDLSSFTPLSMELKRDTLRLDLLHNSSHQYGDANVLVFSMGMCGMRWLCSMLLRG